MRGFWRFHCYNCRRRRLYIASCHVTVSGVCLSATRQQLTFIYTSCVVVPCGVLRRFCRSMPHTLGLAFVYKTQDNAQWRTAPQCYATHPSGGCQANGLTGFPIRKIITPFNNCAYIPDLVYMWTTRYVYIYIHIALLHLKYIKCNLRSTLFASFA